MRAKDLLMSNMEASPAELSQEKPRVVEALVSQVSAQRAVLEKAGLVFEGEMADSNGTTHQAPTADEVRGRIESKLAFYERKFHQGFTKLLMVPIATPLHYFAEAYDTMVKQYRGSVSAGAWLWDGLVEAEKKLELLYFPCAFADDLTRSGGVTKDKLAPWRVVLVEDMANIPFRGEGKKCGRSWREQRRQLEAGSTPEEYLNTIQFHAHHEGESGFTPEIAIVDALTRFEKEGAVTDDRSVTVCLGTYLPFSDQPFVPYSHWDSEKERAVIGANEARNRHHHFGTRTAVAIE